MVTEKKILVNLLNYMFDNNIEPWNNQTNQKTVNEYLASNSYLSLQLVSESSLSETLKEALEEISETLDSEEMNVNSREFRLWEIANTALKHT